MTLQQLKYFIEIVNCGSMNRAAEELFVAQSSLSNAIQNLEKEVKHRLFIRTPQGISLTTDGAEFLGYARQVVEQTELLEQRWLNKKPSRCLCSISTQHYAFAVNAFVNMVKKTNSEEYEYTLREARTFEIVEDVANLRSDLGILYLNNFNRSVIEKLLHENNLKFHLLFIAQPHIFISTENPLANKKYVTLEDLADYPRLSFEQGNYNSFYFSEEILSTEHVKKDIRVGDRATIFNLMIGLNGYTISTGIVSADLNGDNITAVPLYVDDVIEVGWISHKDIQLSKQASMYLEELKDVVIKYGVKMNE
jgi:Transcriptional regulator